MLQSLYFYIIMPLEKHVIIQWFVPLILIFALPSQFIIHAGRYTLSSFYGGRSASLRRINHRKCRNICIRTLLSTLLLSQGTVHGHRRSMSTILDPFAGPFSAFKREKRRPTYFTGPLAQQSKCPSDSVAPNFPISPGPFVPSSTEISNLLSHIDVLQHHTMLVTNPLVPPTGFTSSYHRLRQRASPSITLFYCKQETFKPYYNLTRITLPYRNLPSMLWLILPP